MKAAVLPDPVGAQARTSRPCKHITGEKRQLYVQCMHNVYMHMASIRVS